VDALEAVVNGRISPGLFRVTKTVGKAITKFSMVEPEEPILIGVSGGKDSNFLSLALTIRSRWLPQRNPLLAALIEWKEHPFSASERSALVSYYETLGIPLEIVSASMSPPSFKGKFDCYLCARNRKRILFDFASQRGVRAVALGHHMDDFIVTTLINMVTRGFFATMMPVQPFFDGKMRIIRPREVQTHREAARPPRQTSPGAYLQFVHERLP